MDSSEVWAERFTEAGTRVRGLEPFIGRKSTGVQVKSELGDPSGPLARRERNGHPSRSDHRASTVGEESARRPLRHLVAYGSTNRYRPEIRSRTSGNSARRPTQTAGSFWLKATMLMMT